MKYLPCVEKHRSDSEQNTNRLRQVFEIISTFIYMHYKTVFSEIYKFRSLVFQKVATGCQAKTIGLQQLEANSVSTPSISILAITTISTIYFHFKEQYNHKIKKIIQTGKVILHRKFIVLK